MRIPGRIRALSGRYSLVDEIPFQLPVASHQSPALMAAFSIDANRAARLLPGRGSTRCAYRADGECS